MAGPATEWVGARRAFVGHSPRVSAARNEFESVATPAHDARCLFHMALQLGQEFTADPMLDLEGLTEHVTPALTNVFLLRRLRARPTPSTW